MKQKAYKYRLYPNEAQRTMFAKTFGCCRKVWNLMLADKISYYKETGKMLTTLPSTYKRTEEYSYLKEVDSLALANVQLNLQKAYSAFFSNPKTGFPKFKSKKMSRNAYTTNNQNRTVSLSGNSIRLPKTGLVKAVIHRLPPEGSKLKSAAVSLDPDGYYYASVLFELPDNPPLKTKAEEIKAIGLDYKSDGLYADSERHTADKPKHYRKTQKRLAKLQKSLSKKKGARKGEEKSRNYEKQRIKLAKLHAHTANQRKDWLHKESLRLAREYDAVCVENLNVKAISKKRKKGFHLGKAAHDNGWAVFLNLLSYKLENRGGKLVKVAWNYPSSQLCSVCGHRQPMPVYVKENGKTKHNDTYVCPECGMAENRDVNAAVNILKEGLRMLKENAA